LDRAIRLGGGGCHICSRLRNRSPALPFWQKASRTTKTGIGPAHRPKPLGCPGLQFEIVRQTSGTQLANIVEATGGTARPELRVVEKASTKIGGLCLRR
jgi:hypothetical protein